MLDHYCLEVYSKQSQKIEFQNGRLFLWSLAWYVLPLKRKNAAPLLRPTWRKQNEGCLQGVQIGVGTSQNVALQNGPDSEVHRIDIWIWWWPHLLVPEAWEMVLARLLSHIRCVSWSPVHCEDEIIPKWFSESRQNLFLQHIQINLTIDFHAFLNHDQRRFVPIGCNNSPDHDWSRLLAFQMASGVDWQVLWTFGMNPIILLIVTSSTVKIFSSDQMKTFPAARSISCNINLPLCNRFWFKGSEINCRDYFLYGLNWRSFLNNPLHRRFWDLCFFRNFLTLLCGFRSIFFFTEETTFWCEMRAVCLELVYQRLCLSLETVSRHWKLFFDTPRSV